MSLDAPHFRWPLRLAGGSFQMVEQDTLDDVVQCVHVLLRTPFGWRPLAPEVGLHDPLWRDRFALDQLAAGLAEWEPRADIAFAASQPTPEGEQTVTVNVELTGP